MGVELSAWRVLAAIGFSAITIFAWECIKALTRPPKLDCDGDVGCLWRRAAQLQAQPGVPKASGNASLADAISAEAGSLLVGTDSSAARTCLVRVFEHGTKPHERNVYSQLGEDGILDHIWECIAPESRVYIEIGTADATTCSTRRLREQGWTGLLLGSGPADASVNLHTASPTGDDIMHVLEAHAAPRDLDLLTIHSDLHTFWALHAALQGGYRPRVIAAAINSNFHPADTLAAPHAPNSQWDGSTVFGAAAGAFDVLFEQLGYSTVAVNQAQSTVFAVSKAAAGQERLLSMEQVAAGVTGEPLCRAAHNCTGDSEWLQVTEDAAVRMRLPRMDWYPMLPAWAVRCAATALPGGSSRVQWGTAGATQWLPTFAPGVVALLPCLPVGGVSAVGAAMVAAQTGAPKNGTAELTEAAVEANKTECGRRPEAPESAARKRACLQAAFQGGSSALETLETRRYSQWYEDGIIDAIFGCILTHDRFYVEFGVESGDECTTRHLREDGWTGLLMDGGFHRPEINLQQEFFNAEGIAYQFRKHSVPLRFDHLTIDIDQNTFWVLHAVLLAGYRPRVIVAEVNRNFHPADAFTVPYTHDKMWDQSGDFGASPGAYDALFAAFGYHTLALDQDQINIYAVQSCEVGPERLFSMDEVTAGLTRHGACLGLHGCNDGDHLQVTPEVAGLLTRPRGEWYDLMPRWRIVCSEPAQQDPARAVRILTGVQRNDTATPVHVPRMPPHAATAAACAPIAEATAAAVAAAAAVAPLPA